MQLLHSSETSSESPAHEEQEATGAVVRDESTHSPNSQEADGNLSHVKSLIRELIDLRATAFNNLAAAQMRANTFDQALKSVNSSLDLRPDNVKALYRKGKILASKNDFAEAIECFKSAARLEPESRAIQQEIASLAAKRRQEIAKERRLYQKMLQVHPDHSSTSPSVSWLTGLRSCLATPRVAILFASFSVLILAVFVFYVRAN